MPKATDPNTIARFAQLVGLGCTQHEAARAVKISERQGEYLLARPQVRALLEEARGKNGAGLLDDVRCCGTTKWPCSSAGELLPVDGGAHWISLVFLITRNVAPPPNGDSDDRDLARTYPTWSSVATLRPQSVRES